MNKRICILEDTAEILEIITIVLEEEKYEVFGFGTVAAFNENINNLSPDLYLLDVMLPDGNGLDVCRELKLDKHNQAIPVVMMSANLQITSSKQDCGAEEFIAKPFDIYQLVATIDRLTTHSPLQSSI